MPTFNADLPEPVVDTAVPTEAVVGFLDSDVALEDFVAAMAAEGIDGDRIHVLAGQGGIEVLENMGSRLGRFFGPDRAKPLTLLRSGSTLVAVFEVDDSEQELVAKAVSASGATVRHHFGRWTYF